MLTTMTEEDWTIVLKLFEASRSRRGDKPATTGSFARCTAVERSISSKPA